MSGDRVPVALGVFSALTLASVTAEYVAPGSARLWLADGGWTAGALVAVIGVASATRRSAPRERLGWVLLLCGCAAWLLGQLFWDAYTATSFPLSPNPADVLWLALAVLSAAGLHRLCRGGAPSLDASLREVAPLIVAVSALVVALLIDDLRASPLSGAAQVTSLAYPILYVSAALVMLQAVLAGALDLRRNRGLAAVLGGLVFNAIGFILWAPQLLAATYVAGTNVVDALWSAAMVLIGVGAWSARPVTAVADADAVSRRRVGVLPALTFVLLAGVHTILSAEDGGADVPIDVALWIVGVTLIAHGSVLRRRQTALLAQLRTRERELRDANRLLNHANGKLSQESRRDALTGLGNRLGLDEDFAELAARARRYGEGYCVVLIDLDRFKGYNDDYGHQAGDRVLVQIGELLDETMRASERAYRYGGEELVLVLRDQDVDAGRSLVERQRAQLERLAVPHPANRPHGVVTLSAGVAAARRGETPEEVLRRADTALYEGKALGRNTVAVSDPVAAPKHASAVGFTNA